jgi:hypothetical protein
LLISRTTSFSNLSSLKFLCEIPDQAKETTVTEPTGQMRFRSQVLEIWPFGIFQCLVTRTLAYESPAYAFDETSREAFALGVEGS